MADDRGQIDVLECTRSLTLQIAATAAARANVVTAVSDAEIVNEMLASDLTTSDN